MIPVLKTFEAILNQDEASFSSMLPENVSAKKELMEIYDISPAQVEVLASLIQHRASEVSARKLNVIATKYGENPFATLRDLTERGFIVGLNMMSRFDSCYRLTDEAYAAFQQNQPFGRQLFVDCIAEIKKVTFGKLFSKRWRENLRKSLDLPENQAVRKKLDELGVTKLEEETQLAFWVMVYQFINHFITPLAYRNGEDVLEGIDYSQEVLKYDLGLLVKEGLVQTLPIEPLEDTKDTDRFVLAPKVVGALFRGHDDLIRYEEISKYADFIKSADIVEMPLFFSPDAQEEIDHLRVMLSEEGFARACRILKKQKRTPAIQSLLWGPPGTGKTETVKQLAKETGRDVILFDLAKVTASAWGATEKYYRAIFRAYNYMVAISSRIPILLMNEADAMLSKRIKGIEKSIDKSENAISNILLQAFEDMSGILLATTNLIDNLDEAFDRRFLFKTQLVKPDAAARAKIWKSNIPELTDEEAENLACSFEMSGAQIFNVATKRGLAEIYFDGDRGYAFIVNLCVKELSTEQGSTPRPRRIGF
ncbi:MAG: AAA family ATPase [Bacteroidales bacterium]|nr:AAA family ATPase [Bacteroidales bacterium]